MAGRKKKRRKLPPLITTVNVETLRATAVVRQIVQMRNSARAKQSHAINIVIAEVADYDMILGVALLQKQNPNVQWDTGVEH
jgi:hypothetical protein